MNRTVSNRRLLKLAAFLRELPRKRFDYSEWVGPDWKGDPTLSCGTTACAFGWAAAMPEFRKAGLGMKQLQGGSWSLARFSLKGKTADPIELAETFFGVGEEEAIFLFEPLQELGTRVAPPGDATPKQVAAHIERFVKERA